MPPLSRMRLCIDASNVKAGGGATHLTELLRAADPPAFGFETVFLWAPKSTLRQVEDRPWLVKRWLPLLERNYVVRAWWQFTQLGAVAQADGCDLLFVVGGSFATSFRPVVAMSRNVLPFELAELLRFGLSRQTLRLLLLRVTQSRSFRAADGVVFLTRCAHDAVLKVTGGIKGKVAIIPHGIDTRFAKPPRAPRPLANCSDAEPLRLLYVSTIDVYKHQWRVVEAVARLHSQGIPLFLELIGPAYRPALRRLHKALRRFDPHGRAARYLGPLPYSELHASYARADIVVFASSCENMPNVLLEAMASGLPIACSNRGPMPEVLGGNGVYFDPEDVAGIAQALLELIRSPCLRARLARGSYEVALQYSWGRCATETFAFLAQAAAGGSPGTPRS
jgi:glycosyltransferase involved in cell wall biosynthesis